jgi:hypothetical protein
MSEKIYTCLLRLFPSAFRRHYQEEALRLLRDRLRDERGFFPRLRLLVNLMADTVGALPQAYRNTYAEAAPASALTPHFEGAPSFQTLQTEPIRPATIAIAGILSLTALAIFMFMMGRPVPYRPAAQSGPMSPIESVIERLNQSISPDSAESAGPNTPEPTSAETGRSEARPLSRTNAIPSYGAKSAASAASQPPQPDELNPNTSRPDHGPSPTVAVSSPLAQGQPATIQDGTQGAIPSNVQASIHAAVVANLSGKWWAASFRALPADAAAPQWFILKQDGAKLTGTGGLPSSEQCPILHGFVDGDSVMFELNNRGTTLLYDLRFEDKELRGTLSIKSGNERRTTEVRLAPVR